MNRRREQPDRTETAVLPQFRAAHREPYDGDGVVRERGDPDLESTARYRSTTPPDGLR
jgi:hypothetical protein